MKRKIRLERRFKSLPTILPPYLHIASKALALAYIVKNTEWNLKMFGAFRSIRCREYEADTKVTLCA